jgi:hypothetical protein
VIKRYSNWNACYSCGFDVAIGHCLHGGFQDDAASGIPLYRPPAALVMNDGYGLTGGYIPCGPPAHANLQQKPYSYVFKRYSYWNACYSYGLDVANGHTSMTCPPHLHKALYQIEFNHQNVQQYTNSGHPCSTRNRHNTQFPTNMRRSGAANDVASKCINPFYVTYNSLYPTQCCMSAKKYDLNESTGHQTYCSS